MSLVYSHKLQFFSLKTRSKISPRQTLRRDNEKSQLTTIQSLPNGGSLFWSLQAIKGRAGYSAGSKLALLISNKCNQWRQN
jgi:hypothetical protein